MCRKRTLCGDCEPAGETKRASARPLLSLSYSTVSTAVCGGALASANAFSLQHSLSPVSHCSLPVPHSLFILTASLPTGAGNQQTTLDSARACMRRHRSRLEGCLAFEWTYLHRLFLRMQVRAGKKDVGCMVCVHCALCVVRCSAGGKSTLEPINSKLLMVNACRALVHLN